MIVRVELPPPIGKLNEEGETVNWQPLWAGELEMVPLERPYTVALDPSETVTVSPVPKVVDAIGPGEMPVMLGTSTVDVMVRVMISLTVVLKAMLLAALFAPT